MSGAAILALMLAPILVGAGPPASPAPVSPAPVLLAVDPAAFARGAAAVGERPSAAMALREAAAKVPAPSPSFRLGAAYRAWRNAGAAIARDAAHSTGDGGDEELLAEDCSDERIAYLELEGEREALKLTPDQVAAGLPAPELAAWRARATQPVAHCRR